MSHHHHCSALSLRAHPNSFFPVPFRGTATGRPLSLLARPQLPLPRLYSAPPPPRVQGTQLLLHSPFSRHCRPATNQPPNPPSNTLLRVLLTCHYYPAPTASPAWGRPQALARTGRRPTKSSSRLPGCRYNSPSPPPVPAHVPARRHRSTSFVTAETNRRSRPGYQPGRCGHRRV